jgi:tetratricopeptide (TPR) repeat protein
MKGILPLTSLGILFLFFLVSIDSVIQTKFVELRLGIQKNQLMNYELSSKALREKFRRIFLERENIEGELRLNALESNLLNTDLSPASLNLRWSERLGWEVVNLVRILTLKSRISIQDDEKNLLLLQLAFYQERTRQFSLAKENYLKLLNSLPFPSDEYGFAKLHMGFCLMMMGNSSEGDMVLNELVAEFPGTHYADSAKILLNLIQENKRKLTQIGKSNYSDSEKARRFYSLGKYEEVISLLKNQQKITNPTRYLRARSFEELGNTESALEDYFKILEEGIDRDLAKKANRRLLLLGSIYSKDDALSSIAERNAKSLGDTEILPMVRSAKEEIKETKIIQILEKLPDPEFKENLKQISERKEQIQEFSKNIISQTGKITDQNGPGSEIPKIQPPPGLTMKLSLKDGRVWFCNFIEVKNGSLSIQMDQFPIRMPAENLQILQPSVSGKIQSENFILITEKSGKETAVQSIQYSDGRWVLTKKTSAGDLIRVLEESEVRELKVISNF